MSDNKIRSSDKGIIWFFFILGSFTLIFGFLYIRNNIRSAFFPFQTDLNTKTDAEIQQEQLLALRSQDSDNDTLMDYDELYQYSTSPYIADTDSDGIADNEEIKNNTNPLCPEGKECWGSANANGNTNSQSASLTPNELREILIANGVPRTKLDQMNDAQLMLLYQDVINEVNTPIGSNANANTDDYYADLLYNANTNAASQDLSKEELANLTPEQIRELLISTGTLTEDEMANISDEQLQSIFQASLEQESSNQESLNN